MAEVKREEIAWNIVAEQTKFIGELLQEATAHYLEGDIGSWFNTLTAIRENIDYDLNKDEKKTLNDLEANCWNLQKYWKGFVSSIKEGKSPVIELRVKKKKYIDNVREYSRNLLKILNTLGYFPKKEDRTKLSF